MSIFTNSGRVAVAESVLSRPIHIAWGTGDGSWVTPPTENNAATALMNEVGRHTATELAYVIPDPEGDVIGSTGTYSRSATPTNHILIVAAFDFANASSSVIREVAAFVGSTMVGGLPGGQTYFEPAQVATPGRLLSIEHIAPIFRSPAIRENFEIVVTF